MEEGMRVIKGDGKNKRKIKYELYLIIPLKLEQIPNILLWSVVLIRSVFIFYLVCCCFSFTMSQPNMTSFSPLSIPNPVAHQGLYPYFSVFLDLSSCIFCAVSPFIVQIVQRSSSEREVL